MARTMLTDEQWEKLSDILRQINILGLTQQSV